SLNFSRRTSPSERDHFNREGKGSPQYRDSFGMVDQDDELFGRSRDNLFLQERAAAALDEIESRIDLICPIDRDIDDPSIVGIDEDNSLLPGKCGCFILR